jgi:predicted DNA-binding transcriptional regulator AlpA
MTIKLAGVHEIAAELGLSKQRVHQLAGQSDFPRPVAVLQAGSIWDLDEIAHWRNEHRPISQAVAHVPRRDPDRPQDDPWDADAVRYLMQFTSRSRGWLMEHLRGQQRLDQNVVAKVRAMARKHGVECRPHIDGKTVHFFRSDPGAPTPYPTSETERRAWRSAGA